MKYNIFIILLLTLYIFDTSNAQTLADYLEVASEKNPQLKAKYTDFEVALQQVAQVNFLPDPNISLGYFISPVETRVGAQQTRIGLSQMFPWFGTLKTAENVSKLQAEATYQEFLNAKNQLFMQVKTAYYPLYEVKRKIILQKENLAILNSYKQLATTGFKNSKNSMVDVIRVEIMIENIQTDIKLLQDQIKPLETQFNILLNRPDSLSVLVADSLFLIDYQELRDFENHPVLQSFDLKIQATQQAEILAQKQRMPKFGLGLDYVIVAERNDMAVPDNGKDVFMPMVSMSLPIYRKKYDAAVKETQLKQTALNYYKESFENQLVAEFEQTLYNLKKSEELLRLYDKQTQNTQQAINLLMIAYANLGKDFEDILRMQQELLKYQIAEANALTLFYISLAKLDYLTSKTE
jgi:outer membrane protein TolC